MGRQLQGQLLTWFGIVGGALSLASYWFNFRQPSDWLRRLLEKWETFQHYFWQSLGNLFQVKISIVLSNSISLILFYLFIMIGSIIQSGKIRYWSLRDQDHYNFLILFNIVLLICLSSVYIELNYVGDSEYFLYTLMYTIEFFILMLALIEGAIAEKLISGLFYTVLFLSFSNYFLGIFDLYDPIVPSSAMGGALIAISLILAPNLALNRKVGFLLLGVAVLLGINEISKFTLTQRPLSTELDQKRSPAIEFQGSKCAGAFGEGRAQHC